MSLIAIQVRAEGRIGPAASLPTKQYGSILVNHKRSHTIIQRMDLKRFRRRLMNVSGNSILRNFRQWRRRHEVDYLSQIPTVALSEVVGKPLIRVIGSYSYVEGSLPWCDTLALLSVLVDRAPKAVVEIGTFNGNTTRLIALNLPDAEIHTIDLPEDFSDTGEGLPKDDWHLISARRVGAEYRSDPSITSVTQHFGDTAEYDFPLAEFYFIDGAHTYEYARNDTEKALRSPRVKTLMWHDSDQGHHGVTSWLVEMIQSGYSVRQIADTNLAILDLRDYVAATPAPSKSVQAPISAAP